MQDAHVTLCVAPSSSSFSPWMMYPHMQTIRSAIAHLPVRTAILSVGLARCKVVWFVPDRLRLVGVTGLAPC